MKRQIVMGYVEVIYKHIHSVQINRIKKNQTMTILTDNKTKFRNIEKLRYRYFCCCLEIFLIEILHL